VKVARFLETPDWMKTKYATEIQDEQMRHRWPRSSPYRYYRYACDPALGWDQRRRYDWEREVVGSGDSAWVVPARS
jgi:hypothetical protein